MTVRELTTRLVPVGDLEPHPDNPNDGDVPAVRELLRRYGQWRPVVAQVRDGAPLRVLIGHTMLRAAQAEGWDRIAVHERHVDDDDARRILAADNHSRDLAHTDERALLRLLGQLGDDLDGTTYRPDDLDNLRALVDTQDAAVLRNLRERVAADDRPPSGEGARSPHIPVTPDRRHLTVPLLPTDYEWVVERLTAIADDEGVDGPAEAVVLLVEQCTGEVAPTHRTP